MPAEDECATPATLRGGGGRGGAHSRRGGTRSDGAARVLWGLPGRRQSEGRQRCAAARIPQRSRLPRRARRLACATHSRRSRADQDAARRRRGSLDCAGLEQRCAGPDAPWRAALLARVRVGFLRGRHRQPGAPAAGVFPAAFLAPEITRAIDVATAQGTAVDAVITCGNLPDLRSLTMPLIEELDREVETLDRLDGLTVRPDVADRIRDLAPAIRLACAGAISRPARVLDFRIPAHRVAAGALRRGRGPDYWRWRRVVVGGSRASRRLDDPESPRARSSRARLLRRAARRKGCHQRAAPWLPFPPGSRLLRHGHPCSHRPFRSRAPSFPPRRRLRMFHHPSRAGRRHRQSCRHHRLQRPLPVAHLAAEIAGRQRSRRRRQPTRFGDARAAARSVFRGYRRFWYLAIAVSQWWMAE